MDGDAGRPAALRGSPAARGSAHAVAPLVGRADALRAFGAALDATGQGDCCFLGLVGEPGAGKTRLLGELATAAVGRGLVTLWGRAAEFEQEMPFGGVVDALDDQVEAVVPSLAAQLGGETSALLASVLPSAAGRGCWPWRTARVRPRPRPDRPVPDLPRDAAAAGGPGRSARPGADPRRRALGRQRVRRVPGSPGPASAPRPGAGGHRLPPGAGAGAARRAARVGHRPPPPADGGTADLRRDRGAARPGPEPAALPGAARGQRRQSVLPGSTGPDGPARAAHGGWCRRQRAASRGPGRAPARAGRPVAEARGRWRRRRRWPRTSSSRPWPRWPPR